MKLYIVGLTSPAGKKAYVKDARSEGLTLAKSNAMLFGLDAAAKERNWLQFSYPQMATFMEPFDEQPAGSEPANCPACDAGHCGKHS